MGESYINPVSGGVIAAGRHGAPLRVWQQLTVAPHSRKVIALQGNGTNQTFAATKSIAVEAQSQTTVSAIPARAFSTPVLGDDGHLYLTGGLHSNYQGNEIDRMSLPTGLNTVVTTEISHQPNMPPEGKFSGYASGNGGYIYRQYDTGLADNSNWQPYPGHQWTKNGWHPDWGFFSLTAHALQGAYPNGSYQTAGGVLQSSAAQPGDDYGQQEENWGVVGFDYATGKYKTYLSTSVLTWPQTYLGASGVSDYNATLGEIVFLQTNGGTLYVNAYTAALGLVARTTTSQIGGYDGQSGNGILIRHLEADKYLLLKQDGSGTWVARSGLWLYQESLGAGNARFVQYTTPADKTNDIDDNVDGLSFCIDKYGRRVFWLVFPGVLQPCRVYVSSFDSLMTWVELTITPSITVPNTAYMDAWIAACRQPMIYKSGYLYLFDGSGSGPSDPGYLNGAVNLKRAFVGAA